jgi:hypothetical protein
MCQLSRKEKEKIFKLLHPNSFSQEIKIKSLLGGSNRGKSLKIA